MFVCAHCPSSCHCTSLERAWLHLCIFPSDIYMLWWDPHLSLNATLSALPHMRVVISLDLCSLSFHSVHCILVSLILRSPELDTVVASTMPVGGLNNATSLWTHAHNSTIFPRGSYRRKCWKPYWSLGRQCPLLSPHLPGKSFCHRRLSSWSSVTSPLGKQCWVILMMFLLSLCLEVVSIVTGSVTSSGNEVRLTDL